MDRPGVAGIRRRGVSFGEPGLEVSGDREVLDLVGAREVVVLIGERDGLFDVVGRALIVPVAPRLGGGGGATGSPQQGRPDQDGGSPGTHQ